MKQKLWTLAFVFSLLKTQLNFFHGRMDGDWTLETQGSISMGISLATPQSPMQGSLDSFRYDPFVEHNLHWQQTNP